MASRCRLETVEQMSAALTAAGNESGLERAGENKARLTANPLLAGEMCQVVE